MSEPAPLLQPLKPAAVPPRLWNGARFVPDDWRTIADDEALLATSEVGHIGPNRLLTYELESKNRS